MGSASGQDANQLAKNFFCWILSFQCTPGLCPYTALGKAVLPSSAPRAAALQLHSPAPWPFPSSYLFVILSPSRGWVSPAYSIMKKLKHHQALTFHHHLCRTQHSLKRGRIQPSISPLEEVRDLFSALISLSSTSTSFLGCFKHPISLAVAAIIFFCNSLLCSQHPLRFWCAITVATCMKHHVSIWTVNLKTSEVSWETRCHTTWISIFNTPYYVGETLITKQLPTIWGKKTVLCWSL